MTLLQDNVLTRRALIWLAAFTLVDFAVCGALGNHNHGVRQFFADVTWFAFLIGLLLLVVASGFVLVRSRRRTV